MLNNLIQNQLVLGIAQAGTALLLSLLVIALTRWQSLHMEAELLVSIVRGLAQIVLVGVVLVVVLKGPLAIGALVLALMMVFAAMIASRRSKNLPGAFKVSLTGIFLGSSLVLLITTLLGVVETKLTALIPIGSMIIANSMNASSLALDRFESEVRSHTGQIEAGLALGATPHSIIQRFTRSAYQASLIPTVNSLRSLGIVWIPGLMAGMVLAGEDPVYAALYQFVVMGILFTANALASLTCSLLIRGSVFSAAGQLLLRGEKEE